VESRVGRFKATGASSLGSESWARVRINGRGTADEGLGVIDATVDICDKKGRRDATWKVNFHRTTETILDVVVKAAGEFERRFPLIVVEVLARSFVTPPVVVSGHAVARQTYSNLVPRSAT
jgi:hypothetical protein